jgi:hypothetical protein
LKGQCKFIPKQNFFVGIPFCYEFWRNCNHRRYWHNIPRSGFPRALIKKWSQKKVFHTQHSPTNKTTWSQYWSWKVWRTESSQITS